MGDLQGRMELRIDDGEDLQGVSEHLLHEGLQLHPLQRGLLPQVQVPPGR